MCHFHIQSTVVSRFVCEQVCSEPTSTMCSFLRRIHILSLGLKEFLSPFQMLLEEKADALREEAEEMTTAPELLTAERTEN